MVEGVADHICGTGTKDEALLFLLLHVGMRAAWAAGWPSWAATAAAAAVNGAANGGCMPRPVPAYARLARARRGARTAERAERGSGVGAACSVALDVDAVCRYVASKQGSAKDLEYWMTEPMFLSGLYWGLNTVSLLNHPHAISHTFALGCVARCRRPGGGYGAHAGHDAHILFTLSAVQILALCGSLRTLSAEDVEATVCYVAGLQQPDGSFAGDEFGDHDTRYSYAALSCLQLLGRLGRVDTQAAADHIMRCGTPEGGFGMRPGSEAHAGQTFCCVAALAIAGQLGRLDASLVVGWLKERQLPCGGVNGRPDKREDGCYGWWVTAPLAILLSSPDGGSGSGGGTAGVEVGADVLAEALDDVLDTRALATFLGTLQSDEGGFSPRPAGHADIFHTHFAVAALAVLRHPRTCSVDPVTCMPSAVARAPLGN